MPSPQYNFAGFWRRLGAASIDVLLILLVTLPVLIGIYGMEYFDYEKTGFIAGPADFLVSYFLPAVATIWFWVRYRSTPGKLALRAYIVDAETGNPITLRQSVIRYLGYFVSLAPLGLGYLWVAFDQRKQGWHDKMAGTVVTYRPSSTASASEA
jgi:uncharacterized RDD family membrane protein YckC